MSDNWRPRIEPLSGELLDLAEVADEHMPDIQAALEDIARGLREKGDIKLTLTVRFKPTDNGCTYGVSDKLSVPARKRIGGLASEYFDDKGEVRLGVTIQPPQPSLPGVLRPFDRRPAAAAGDDSPATPSGDEG